MRLIKLLAMTLVAPIIGLVVARLILGDLDAKLATQGLVSLDFVCAQTDLPQDVTDACNALAPVRLLQWLATIGGAIPLVLIALQLGLSRFAGRRREAMAAVFPPLTRITVLALAVMVAVQAAVAIGAMWYGESFLLGRVHVGIMLALALGALGAGWALLSAVLASGRRPTLAAIGKALTPQTAPALFAHVRALAERLGAKPPRHIVVGLEPNFYVTHADVSLVRGERLKGETLYLSAAAARLLTPLELDAVIGHELGHFRGQDTAYSLRFAPVYAGLGGAIHGMIDEKGAVHWAAVPAFEMLTFLYELFAGAESAVGRARELEADRAGAEAASAEALGLALLKTGLFADAWGEAMAQPGFVYGQGKAANLSAAFLQRIRGGFSEDHARASLEGLLAQRTAHPIDTHPPMGERLAALGFSLEGLDLKRLAPPADGASGAEVIDGLDGVEAALSELEHHIREALGLLPAQALPPPSDERTLLERQSDRWT